MYYFVIKRNCVYNIWVGLLNIIYLFLYIFGHLKETKLKNKILADVKKVVQVLEFIYTPKGNTSETNGKVIKKRKIDLKNH